MIFSSTRFLVRNFHKTRLNIHIFEKFLPSCLEHGRDYQIRTHAQNLFRIKTLYEIKKQKIFTTTLTISIEFKSTLHCVRCLENVACCMKLCIENFKFLAMHFASNHASLHTTLASEISTQGPPTNMLP